MPPMVTRSNTPLRITGLFSDVSSQEGSVHTVDHVSLTLARGDVLGNDHDDALDLGARWR